MQKITDFLLSHWETLVTALGGALAWLTERRKRKQEQLDASVAFWERTIDRQNAEIEKLQAKIEAIERRYESQVQGLQKTVEELSAKLEQYENNHPHTL